MAQVVIEKLTRRFSEKDGASVTAVNEISLTIRDREFIVLVGPSGCGKSTTLRMIAGLEEITGGSISIDGRVVNEVAPKDRDIAMVFQNYALYPHMSVYENMAFGLKLRKFPKSEIDTRVREAATLLGIEPLLNRRPKALSGGQRQRIAVGRAIVRKPKVFLLDEPLSNLDAKSRVSTRAEISRLHARLGATMIYVTHDQVEAMTMGNRICVMNEGRIMQVDEPLTLYNRPANLFVAGFIGSPSMNLFRGTLRQGTGQVLFEGESANDRPPVSFGLPESFVSLVGHPPGKPVILGIRPENLHAAITPAPGPIVTAKVEISEPMGAETFLHLSAGAASFTARVAPTERYQRGQAVSIGFDLERAHLFDAENGRRIAVSADR